MNRRFNYTGRTRITRDRFTIRLTEDPAGGPSRFTADLSGLMEMGLDSSAKVIVEPYVRMSSMRFDFGTVGKLNAPGDTLLTDIDRGAAVQFRVKVIDTVEKPGRLLALADQVRPKDENDDGELKSILPVKKTDLGEAVWRIEVSVDESPVLLLNNRVPDLLQRLSEDPVLQGAIFPVAVREVLRVLLFDGPASDLEWVEDWRGFVEALRGEELPDALEENEARTLIDHIIDDYCRRERWATVAQPAETATEADYE